VLADLRELDRRAGAGPPAADAPIFIPALAGLGSPPVGRPKLLAGGGRAPCSNRGSGVIRPRSYWPRMRLRRGR
jgi:hypothetical protein